MSLELRISPGSNIPIYKQIMDQVRRAVATGRQVAGDQLPSVRVLAEQLVINPNTVARAYAELARDGVLEAIQGKGHFVADKRQVYSRAERSRRLALALELFISEAVILDFSPDEIKEALDKKFSDFKTKKSKHKG